MRAQSEKEQVQGVRRGAHLLAQSGKEPVQDVQSRQGRVHAAGSRGALDLINTGFCTSSRGRQGSAPTATTKSRDSALGLLKRQKRRSSSSVAGLHDAFEAVVAQEMKFQEEGMSARSRRMAASAGARQCRRRRGCRPLCVRPRCRRLTFSRGAQFRAGREEGAAWPLDWGRGGDAGTRHGPGRSTS